MAYKVLFMFNRGVMKELGEYLKETRELNGVELEEAADDLEIEKFELENIEEGNVRAFRDVLSMKEIVKEYAKYLGLDPEKVIDEFNDFLFEHTSKISLEDIMEAAKEKDKEEKEKKVHSPYTKIKKRKINKKMIVNIVLIILFTILILTAINEMRRPKKEIINAELLNEVIRGDVNEFTY